MEEPNESNQHQQNVRIIMRQTEYTMEDADDLLKKHGSVEKCIEEYLGIKKNRPTSPVSTNQSIYKSIREWMN